MYDANNLNKKRPLIAFRGWENNALHRGRLYSTTHSHQPWQREAQSVCQAFCSHYYFSHIEQNSPTHQAPEINCSCGFHSYYSLDKACQEGYGSLWGAVACWGKIILHDKGLRSEFARPIALFIPQPTRWKLKYKRLKHFYGLDLISYDQFMSKSASYGQLIQEDF